MNKSDIKFKTLRNFLIISLCVVFLGPYHLLSGVVEENRDSFIQSSYLNKKERSILLQIARKTLEKAVSDQEIPEFADELEKFSPNFNKKAGVFVTLKKGKELRGCIGNLTPNSTLFESVISNTINAAFFDRRFYPVKEEELEEIEIEISVLSPIRKIDTYESFDMGRHGIILKKGNASAVFLPQVAKEQNWTKEEMLSNLCLKAGLSRDSWKDNNAIADNRLEFFVFTAEVFGKSSDF